MIIRINNLTKTYKHKAYNTNVFNNVNLEIKQGDFVGVVGRSGSGKSTFLNILGFLDTPNGGEYFFNGEHVDFTKTGKLNELRRNNMSFIRQDYGLLNEYNVKYNISLPLNYLKNGKVDINSEVERVAEMLDIKDKLSKFPTELSGGECQRVAISRAIITNPSLILADEPTGSLDVENEDRVINILKEINLNGTTIIIATHSNDIANKCNTLLSIQQGKIIKIK